MKQVALITGAGGYIGGQIAKDLAKEQIIVVLADSNLETAEKKAAEVQALGLEARAVYCDVTDSASVNEAVAMTVSAYGRLDIAVHAAGGSSKIAGPHAQYLPLAEQEDYVLDRVLKVNLYGALYVSRAAAKQMILQGAGGRIVHITSAIGINGLVNKTDYAAAKGGVIAMIRSLAKEVGPYGITVNGVAPGAVGNAWVPDDAPGMCTTNFLGIRGSAPDISSAVRFLCSADARFITGQNIPVDGGRTLCMKGSE
ncbi:MAG: SDR family NAD(P)-dependent oxidoreductase [Eubacteriales bacterium]